LGVIKAYLIEKEGQKELYIDMMSVNPTKMKKGIMSHMIKELRDTFKLEQDQITFSKLTPEGEKFVAKKTYADGGEIIDFNNLENIKKGDFIAELDSNNNVVKFLKVLSVRNKELVFQYLNERTILPHSYSIGDLDGSYSFRTLTETEKFNVLGEPKTLGLNEMIEKLYTIYSKSSNFENKEPIRVLYTYIKKFDLPIIKRYQILKNNEIVYDTLDDNFMKTPYGKKNYKYTNGGEAAEYQIIDKKTEKYYSRSISDGKIKWNDSPDMGYMFTMKDANQIKESLHQSGYEQLEVVKYDANWWRKAKYEKGGAIYPDLSLQKADVVNDSITLNEFEIKKMKNTFKIDGIEKLKITSSQDAVNILRKLFDEDTINAYEQAYILYLNNNNKVIGYYHHSSGSVTGTVMDVQMISGMALKSLAKGVIIAHNHPSENTIPSDADKRITKQLQNALNIFNIVLMDSIILTDDSYTSFADDGLL
jgi:DNA repair protein RadC